METILVACETIQDEILGVLGENSLSYPVIWLEGGLHDNPDRLRARIQEVLDAADGRCGRLLLSLGFCGGGVSGLTTGGYETVLPLADDCVSLLLGSMAARREASRPATYFLTAGWMRHENNVIRSYDRTVARFGRGRADRINRVMLKNYRRFALVRTGCYALAEAESMVRPLADKMGMAVEALPADLGWLARLLTGPHDDPSLFLTLPPRSALGPDRWDPLLWGDRPPGRPAVPAGG
ncbi:MAG: DUF1638 domain-containing protein [Deltaproteobacteria bacterium]|jgi:hypothetical protein|nr:DUF1638 domain-containing protein [Deltaproteobacteria bacterium]